MDTSFHKTSICTTVCANFKQNFVNLYVMSSFGDKLSTGIKNLPCWFVVGNSVSVPRCN